MCMREHIGWYCMSGQSTEVGQRHRRKRGRRSSWSWLIFDGCIPNR